MKFLPLEGPPVREVCCGRLLRRHDGMVIEKENSEVAEVDYQHDKAGRMWSRLCFQYSNIVA